jgi:chromosome segregation ATPase
MREQQALEAKYRELVEQRAAMKGMVNKSKYKEVQEEIQDVSRALKESTNSLVRNLKENPNVSGNLIKVQRDRTECSDLLLRCVQELRDRGTYHTIISKVDEENNARLRLQQLRSREKGLREVVRKLEEQLHEEQAIYQKTVSDQKKAIAHLKDELLTIKGTSMNDAKFKRKESLAHVAAVWREFKMKERDLEAKLKALESRVQTEHIVHNETKEYLIRKNHQLADDLIRWDARYDEEVGAMDAKIAKLTNSREALVAQLDVLRERRRVEEEAEQARNEAAAAEALATREAAARLKRMNAAAKCLQKNLRNFLSRRRAAEASGGDTKKNKKKGAGKKKK